MNHPKIVLLAGKGISTNILFHALQKSIPITAIILEEPVSKKQFLKKRIKKLGLLKVLGQVLFQTMVVPFLNLATSARKKEILEQFGLDDSPLPAAEVITVSSVNDSSCIQKLQEIEPNLVIVNGTRIISGSVLNAVNCKFINIHAGITPKYRGVHGAYWALLSDDPANCGVTVHLVDPGIDTGSIISQKTITVTRKDNFVTYPLLQLAAGIPMLQTAIADCLGGDLDLKSASGSSQLWYHPTIGQYLYHRLFRKKK
jgi:folate-dependent phosphoribosylglycinamide formyltransferase PurN